MKLFLAFAVVALARTSIQRMEQFLSGDICAGREDTWKPDWGKDPSANCKGWWDSKHWGAGHNCEKCAEGWAHDNCQKMCCTQCPDDLEKYEQSIANVIQCADGYVYSAADIHGWGNVAWKSVSSCQQCADMCSGSNACKSYECSPTELHCNLNAEAEGNNGVYKDYVFCTKTASVPTNICQEKCEAKYEKRQCVSSNENTACFCMGRWKHSDKFWGGCDFKGSDEDCIASCKNSGYAGNVNEIGGGSVGEVESCIYGCNSRSSGEPEPKPQLKSEPKPQPKPQPKSEPKAQPKPIAKPQPKLSIPCTEMEGCNAAYVKNGKADFGGMCKCFLAVAQKFGRGVGSCPMPAGGKIKGQPSLGKPYILLIKHYCAKPKPQPKPQPKSIAKPQPKPALPTSCAYMVKCNAAYVKNGKADFGGMCKCFMGVAQKFGRAVGRCPMPAGKLKGKPYGMVINHYCMPKKKTEELAVEDEDSMDSQDEAEEELREILQEILKP